MVKLKNDHCECFDFSDSVTVSRNQFNLKEIQKIRQNLSSLEETNESDFNSEGCSEESSYSSRS